MDFPDDEDILAEEQFMQEYNNFHDDISFDDEPPNLEDIIKPLKKHTEKQVKDVPENTKESERLSRKRLQDDLFGDLDGIEESTLEEAIENYSDAKRPKMSEASTDTSAKTVNALNNLFGSSSPVKSPSPIDHDSYLDRLEAIISTKNAARKYAKSELPLLRRRKYAFRSLPDVPFLSMTNERGERMYMLLKGQDQRHISEVKSHKPGTLLGVSISVLKLQLEKEKEKKEREKREALEKRLESFGSLEFRKRKRHKEAKVESEDSSWLESYRPRKYFDLLSHEATNRALLRWLKLWDKVVFNREVKIRPRLKDGSAVVEDKTPKNQYEGGNKFQRKFAPTDESVIQELDDKGKPMQKVALLCGPPGLGKTTLAHVVATHAGYNVVEMNASDDRTIEAFKLKLETATQMKSVVSSDPRPNCLIIDEIDGAPSASVSFLISYLQAQDGGDKQKGKKRKGGPKALNRPIICICNDLYAPSLRQLRAVALILSFPPTESSRLANRLLEISQEHDIQTDLATLLALCEKAENDIRSCLATLYFFRLQGKSFRLQNVLNSNVGAKDSSKSFFSVWQELFQRQNKGKRSARNMPLQADPSIKKGSEDSERYNSVLDSVQSCGEYERLMSGVFENYLNIKFRDNKMENVSSGLNWMCFYDIINQQISHSQNYSMLAFVPHIFVKLHFLFSGTERPKILFPKVQTEMNAVKSKNDNIVNTITTEMAPSMLIYLTPRILTLDVLPYTMESLTPNFRPVSTQLYSPEERQEALRVVTTMISLNLTYRQERTLDGQYAYVLDPNIEELIYFDKTKQRRQLSYASKQFIAREIELEKMRRFAGSEAPSKAMPEVEKETEELREQPKAVPNHLQTLKAKTVTAIISKPARDFFGRIINKTDKDQPAHGEISGPKDLLRGDIWYHFKEGYSNAVRRKVRVKDFM